MARRRKNLLTSLKRYSSVLRWALLLQIKAAKWWYIFYIFRKFFDTAEPLINSFLIGNLLNIVATGLQQSFNETVMEDIYLNLVYVFSFQAFGHIMHLLIPYIERYKIQKNTRLEYRKVLLNKLIELEWENIENPVTEKRIRTAFNEGEQSLTNFLSMQIQTITIIVTVILSIAAINLPVFVVILTILAAIPQIIINWVYLKENFFIYEESQENRTRAGGIIGFFRSFTMLFETKITLVAPPLRDMHLDLHEQMSMQDKRLDKKFIWWDIASVFIRLFINIAIFMYFLNDVIRGQIKIGTFQFIVTSVGTIRSYTTSIFDQVNAMISEYRYISYAYDFLHSPTKSNEGTLVFEGNLHTIEFRDVWFKYPGMEHWSLKGINFTIQQGQKIALVGENGAGKSTFVKLFLRTYTPTKGQILLNGFPLEEYTRESFYKNVSIITQEFARFDVLTVKENIAVVNPESAGDMEKLKHAAELAEADGFIERLPLKYDTPLTKKIENGTELSSGQWQKIALSRLFFSDHPIFLLDEPTAAIDPVSEHRIFKNIYQKLKNKTVLLVSHRYNTVRAADVILVFRDGQIIEHGSHDELVSQDSYYAHAYQLQKEGKTEKDEEPLLPLKPK
jgi:ABC-type multidrug transport system fused ATPase/permease subunit